MTSFRQLTDSLYVSPQINPGDVAEAARLGMTMIVNNRPDDEEPGQTSGAAIAAEAAKAGLAYRAIPVTHAGFSEGQVATMAEALNAAEGSVLAYCRSGTRSTLLWALSAAKAGMAPAAIAEKAAEAGYDVASIRPLIDMLAGSR